MNSLVKIKIQNAYPGLRPSEQKAADFFLNYRGKMETLLIEDIAKTAKISQPTIIRFARALGYKGFKEFKYALMEEEIRREPEKETQGDIELYGFRLSSKDELDTIPGKIIGTSVKMLEETLRSIHIKEYRKAVEAILQAENIVIYSVENSVCTANDLLTKLTYLGLNCRTYPDYYLQSVSAGNLTKRDLAIGISYSGCSRHTVEMMAVAKKSGAKTLVLTNFEKSVIAKYADILLCASNKQFLYGDTIFSRISQLALVDMLYAGVMNENYEKLSRKLKKNSEAVAKRAYDSEEEIL